MIRLANTKIKCPIWLPGIKPSKQKCSEYSFICKHISVNTAGTYIVTHWSQLAYRHFNKILLYIYNFSIVIIFALNREKSELFSTSKEEISCLTALKEQLCCEKK